ncbi:MAG TPA: fasciclin domain-containing protein, partial [Candidatus Limnocylindrales bacterium]|nr:fasciclin domain-containing protein [Candidatus Limnocylindrales bacterium]
MRKFLLIAVVLLVGVLAAVPAFAQDQTIADIVVASATADVPEFSTLLTAVQAADPGVLAALSDPEAALTVFAPTDAAFAALAESLGEEAFAAVLADPAALTSILLFHVVDGRVGSADVVAALEANEGAFAVPSLNGQYIDISEDMGVIYIDGAPLNLEMVDIEASNGVIHVIDAVMLPESRTIAEIVVDSAAAEAPEFATLLAAVSAADPAVLETLSDPEAELTVFAPTDAAFAALAEAVGEEAFNGILADTEGLTGILLYHVVPGVVHSGDLVTLLVDNDGTVTVATAQGADVTFTVTDEGVFINDAQIISTDIDAANGVIHVIDAV